MLFYALEYKLDSSRQGIVRMCVFVLQTMSVEPSFGKNLNKKFEAQETLPQSIRLSNFRGSYADFLIQSIHTLITGSKGKLDAIYPAMLAIINNMAAYVQNISLAASTRLVQLLASMASPSFLLANETNHTLLQALLESITTMIEHQYTSNTNLIFAVWRARKRIEALRTFTLEGGQKEIERDVERRKEDTETVHSLSRSSTAEAVASPNPRSSAPRSGVDETFAIGDSDDSESEEQPTPSHSTPSVRNSRTPSMASSSAADELPVQLLGMSEKARGKMPAGMPTFSRQNSTTSLSSYSVHRGSFTPTPEWLETWLPDLPLHTLLTIIEVLAAGSPDRSRRSTETDLASHASSQRSSVDSSATDLRTLIPTTAKHPSISPILASPIPIRVHLFEWSPLSLGWYMSVLWSLIFTSEMVIAPTSSTAATLTGTGGTAGPVGVWNSTYVKLFQVATEGQRQGPSLSQPRGAVDAVGSRLVQGVQGLNLGGLVGRVGASVGGGASNGAAQGQRGGATTREI
jgi:hypothetical protein